MVYAITIRTSPLHRVNSVLQRSMVLPKSRYLYVFALSSRFSQARSQLKGCAPEWTNPRKVHFHLPIWKYLIMCGMLIIHVFEKFTPFPLRMYNFYLIFRKFPIFNCRLVHSGSRPFNYYTFPRFLALIINFSRLWTTLNFGRPFPGFTPSMADGRPV